MPSSSVPPDDLFGSSTPSLPPKPALPDDDGDDYELEEPDEEMLQAERRRVEEEVLVAQSAVDIDAIYREADEQTEVSDLWKNFRFQYQTKHLLILTAVVAVLLTARQMFGFIGSVVLVILFTLAGAHVYLGWRESKRQQEVERRRRRIYARQRLVRAGKPASELPPLDAAEEPSEPLAEVEPFQFLFSRNEVLATIAIAAVLIGLIYLFGSGTAAVLLGFIALLGLVVHAVGYQPPNIVVLGWWVMLVMYVVVSVLKVFQTTAS